MEIIKFIKDYWTQIVFLLGLISTFTIQIKSSREATKCSLRNDILDIYEKCKPTQTISLYQLEAVELSFNLYKKLKGNSFVQAIVEEMRLFKRV